MMTKSSFLSEMNFLKVFPKYFMRNYSFQALKNYEQVIKETQ